MTALPLTRAEVQGALVRDHIAGRHIDRHATMCPVCEHRSRSCPNCGSKAHTMCNR
jgi:hypothetical protein